jgi:hypothetical protein
VTSGFVDQRSIRLSYGRGYGVDAPGRDDGKGVIHDRMAVALDEALV